MNSKMGTIIAKLVVCGVKESECIVLDDNSLIFSNTDGMTKTYIRLVDGKRLSVKIRHSGIITACRNINEWATVLSGQLLCKNNIYSGDLVLVYINDCQKLVATPKLTHIKYLSSYGLIECKTVGGSIILLNKDRKPLGGTKQYSIFNINKVKNGLQIVLNKNIVGMSNIVIDYESKQVINTGINSSLIYSYMNTIDGNVYYGVLEEDKMCLYDETGKCIFKQKLSIIDFSYKTVVAFTDSNIAVFEVCTQNCGLLLFYEVFDYTGNSIYSYICEYNDAFNIVLSERRRGGNIECSFRWDNGRELPELEGTWKFKEPSEYLDITDMCGDHNFDFWETPY